MFVGPDMQVRAAHRGCAFGDLNNDGKVDVVVSAIGDGAELLYNTTKNSNHWILIDTIGVKSNRDGIGTRHLPNPAKRYAVKMPRSGHRAPLRSLNPCTGAQDDPLRLCAETS
jgi:hypothetical protein